MEPATISGILKALAIVGLVGAGGALPIVNDATMQSQDDGGGDATSCGETNGIPANKVVASGSHRVEVAPASQLTLLDACLHSSKTSDVLFQVTLECTIWTDLVTNEDTPTSTARGTVLVWVEVDDVIVPINSVSSTNQAPPVAGTDADKVTFCDRAYSRTVEDQEDPSDGLDQEDDYIRTKSSHAFNWVRLNMGNGNHKIEVVADLTTMTEGDASAVAEVGNRVLIAEPTTMANDAQI